MKLELEVLASTSIRRKKPWPQLAFLGEVKESLFLLDSRRISVLYVPSGKTKRKIPKLQPLLEDVVSMTHSRNGHFMVGLLRSGDVFLWHKDTDMLKIIHGLPEFHLQPGQQAHPVPQLCLADDGTKLLVVCNYCRLFLWEIQPGFSLFQPKQPDLKGSWFSITAPTYIPLPAEDTDHKETSISATFLEDEVLGLCCCCSIVFNQENQVCISTVLLKWLDDHQVYTLSAPTFSTEWQCKQRCLVDIAPNGQPIRSRGAYVSSMSHDGHILAVAVNQRSSQSNQVLFVSTLTDTVVVSDLLGSGAREPVTKNARTYWIADMKWTSDDLFLTCVLKQGTLCIMSRLGEPLLLQTFGCSIEMGPKHFLPLHPLISVQSRQTRDEDNDMSIISERDTMRQRFSVTVHPRYPVVLCSDGYMVTVLQLPGESTCLSIIKGLLSESDKHLRRIRDKQSMHMTLFDSLRSQTFTGRSVSSVGRRVTFETRHSLPHSAISETGADLSGFRFESAPADSLLNETQDSDITDFLASGNVAGDLNASFGKIVFGDMSNMNTTVDMAQYTGEEDMSTAQHMFHVQKTLVSAWSFAASHVGLWTDEHERQMDHVLHNVARLMQIILKSDANVLTEYAEIQKRNTSGTDDGMSLALSLYKLLLGIGKVDAVHSHLFVASLKLAHDTVYCILSNKDIKLKEPRLQTLHGCHMLLRYTETVLSQTYTHLAGQVNCNTIPEGLQFSNTDLRTPAVMLDKAAAAAEASELDPSSQGGSAHVVPRQQEKTLWITDNVGQKLAFTWKLLYRHAAKLYVSSVRDDARKSQLKQILRFVAALQIKLIAQGQNVPTLRKTKYTLGTKLMVEGLHASASDAWIKHLHAIPGEKLNRHTGQALLHSILYSLLLQQEVRAALVLVEFLIRQPGTKKAITLSQQPEEVQDSMLALLQEQLLSSNSENVQLPNLYIKSKAARKVVQSFARIMASYFSNGPLYVYPPHTPRRIPPLYTSQPPEGDRVVPLFHETITALVGQQGLTSVWTPERAMELLLLSGLLSEAACFADAVGDWKAAFILSVACCRAGYSSGKVAREESVMQLPERLQPEKILGEKLSIIFEDSVKKEKAQPKNEPSSPTSESVPEEEYEQIAHTLEDLLLGGVMAGVDVTPHLLQQLVHKLKCLCRELSPLVPGDLYLPAPPVFCPQPPITQQESLDEAALQEASLRRRISAVIQLLLVLLEASHCTLHASRWYSQRVMAAWHNAQTLQGSGPRDPPDTPVLEQYHLNIESAFSDMENKATIPTVLSSFRDVCAVAWMLHVRDQLSLLLRQKREYIKLQMQQTNCTNVTLEDWISHCQSCLEWAEHMIPFAHLLNAEAETYGTLLSLLTELPHSINSAQTLAEYFHNKDSLDPEIQDRLNILLKEWNAVFLEAPARGASGKEELGKGPRGVTMSTEYHKMTQKMAKVEKKRVKLFGLYEKFVFADELEEKHDEDSSEIKLVIGSRPYEHKDQYLNFLDTFFVICFKKHTDQEKESQTGNLPLLLPFVEDIRNTELNSMAYKVAINLHKRQIGVNSPRRETSPSRPNSLELVDIQNVQVKTPKRKAGLFRSMSWSDVRDSMRGSSSKRPLASPDGSLKKASSEANIFVSDPKMESPRSVTTRSRSSSLERVRKSPLRSHSSPDGKFNKPPKIPKMRRAISSKPGSTEDLSSSRHFFQSLKNPLMPPEILNKISFKSDYGKLEELLEWLVRWSGKHHILIAKSSQQLNKSCNLASSRAALRIKFQPAMIVYGLWLAENKYSGSKDNRTVTDTDNESQAEVDSFVLEKEKQRTSLADADVEVHEMEVVEEDMKRIDVEGCMSCGTDKKVNDYHFPPPSPRGNAKEAKKKKKKSSKNRQKALGPDQLDGEVIPKDIEQPVEETIQQPVEEQFVQREIWKPLEVPADNEHEAEGDDQVTDLNTERTSSARYTERSSTRRRHPMSGRKLIGSEQEEVEDDLTHVTDVMTDRTRQSRKRVNSGRSDLSHEEDSLNVSSLHDEDTMRKVLKETLARINSAPMTLEDLEAPPVPALPRQTNSLNMTMAQPREAEQAERMSSGDIASSVASAVRQEMRKIMEAQHQGILAMLGALDSKPIDSLYPNHQNTRNNSSQTQVDHRHISNGAQRERRGPGNRSDNVMNAKADAESLTDVDVTPLPSDAQSVRSDQPMVLADLVKTPAQNKQDGPSGGQQVPLGGVLKELKALECEHNPGSFWPSAYGWAAGKENIPEYGHPGPLMSGFNQNHPFARAMEMMNQFNQSMGVKKSEMEYPRTMRLPPERDPGLQPGEFLVPQPSETDSNIPRMPLLQVHNVMAPPQYPPPGSTGGDVIFPTIKTGQSSTNLHPHMAGVSPFPLLTIPGGSLGGPRLVPPEEILEYEQKKYASILKQRQPAAAVRDPSQKPDLPLLKVDLGPFQIGDDRSSIKRQKRRERKHEKKPSKAKASESGTQITPRPDKSTSTSVQAGSGLVDTEVPVELNQGYALTPGMFDELLQHQNELGSAADTNAKLQYKTVTALKPQKKVQIVDVRDISIETDERGLSKDVATATNKDTATSPIKEIIEESRPGQGLNLLAPDIRLGLKFSDAGQEHQGQNGPRAFISVADIGESALNNIMAALPEKEQVSQATPQPVAAKGPKKSPIKTTPSGTRQEAAKEQAAPGPDLLTARLLGAQPLDQSIDELVAADMAAKGYLHRTKMGIRKRLLEMNEQITAIDKMSNHMESEFRDTRLLMHTIENLTDAMRPDMEAFPPSRVVARLGGPVKRPPLPPEDEHREAPILEDRDEKVTKQNGQIDESLEQTDTKLQLSGLSGVSDVVAELAAQGELDMEETGLSHRDIQKLTEKARKSARDESGRLSSEQLREVFQAVSPHRRPRTDAERKQLLEWMEGRRKQRSAEWRKQKQESHEQRPYQPDPNASQLSTLKDIQTAETTRATIRKTQMQEFAEKRKLIASHLMADILSEKPPEQPPLPPPSIESPKSPRRTMKRTDRSLKRTLTLPKKGGSPTRAQPAWHSSPIRDSHMDVDRMDVRADDYLALRDSHDKMKMEGAERGQAAEKPIIVGASLDESELDAVIGSTGPVAAYEERLQEMDQTGATQMEDKSVAGDTQEKPVPSPRKLSPHRHAEEEPLPQPRPYTEMVRVQRPEVTRDNRSRPKPTPYVNRLNQIQRQTSGAQAREESVKAQQRLYGTKRLPGTQSNVRTAPRIVKTYTERLQEMKQKQGTLSQPAAPRSRSRPADFGATYQKPTQPVRRRSPLKGPRKTLTYAQQLQKLQPPKEVYHPGKAAGDKAAAAVPAKRRQGPAHKPKTYVEQLQQLQPPSPSRTYRAAYAPMEYKRYQVTPLRSLVRPRPYADPYLAPDVDRASDVSPWSMDQDVRKLIYDGESSYLEGGTSVAGTDLSDIDQLRMLGADYTDVVGVQDIVDAASVSEGSVMSFIDWDQVDHLIADVH